MGNIAAAHTPRFAAANLVAIGKESGREEISKLSSVNKSRVKSRV